jgi:hypothetical protein
MGAIHDRWAAYKKQQAGGGSVPVSKRRLGNAHASFRLIAAGLNSEPFDFAGAIITKGEDWWGVAGSALPLDMAVGNPTGRLVYPDDAADHSFAVAYKFTFLGGAPNAGKTVGYFFSGNALADFGTVRLDSNGYAQQGGSLTDFMFPGDAGNAWCNAALDTRDLAAEVNVALDVVVIEA